MTERPRIFTRSSQAMPELEAGAAQLIFESPDFEGMHQCCGEPACCSSYAGEPFVAHLTTFLAERFRVLAPTGSYVLNFAAQVLDGFTSPAEFLLPGAVHSAGFRLVQTNHWVKPNAPPTAPHHRLKNSHEFLWHWAKGPDYKFNKDEVRQPHLYAGRDPRTKRYHPLGKDPGNVLLPLGEQVNRVKAPDDNVLVMTKSQDQAQFAHGGKMRDGIAGRFIRLLTSPGDLVVDGFNGTGQTGVEALALGRAYVGYELHEDRASLSRRRLGIEQVGKEDAPMDARLMDIKQCARYLGRTENALRMMVKRKELPYGKQGVRVFFDRQVIDNWVQESITWVAPASVTKARPAQTQPAPGP